MAIDSIIALIDAEIASLTQVRSLLASTGKVAVKVTEPKHGKAAKAPKARKEAPQIERRSAQADCGCAA